MSQGKPEPTPEGRPLNLKQLAEHLHLSQTTVSLVLNNSPAGKSIPQHTRDRVFEAARKFQYRPNYFARSLRNSRSMSIGVIVPDLSDGYFPVVMNAIEAHLLQSHYFYVTASHYRRPELVEEYSRRLMERAVDGLLLLDTPAELYVPVPAVATPYCVGSLASVVSAVNCVARPLTVSLVLSTRTPTTVEKGRLTRLPANTASR